MTMPAGSSFRDPGGFCFTFQDRVFRVVEPGSAAALEGFLHSACARRFLEAGSLIPARRLERDELPGLPAWPEPADPLTDPDGCVVFEHPRVEFPSYPYEWPPEMLFAAAELTLDLAQQALEDGYGLKDATPGNVLFRGPRPVFVDVLSFEPRAAGDPVWKPYAQFVRTFLLPLAVNRALGVRLQDVFLTRRDGVEPEEVYRGLGPLRRLRPPWLGLVSIPAWLARRGRSREPSLYADRVLPDAEKARFIVSTLLRRLRRTLVRLAPRAGKESAWSHYMESLRYSPAAFGLKERFVQGVLDEFRPRRVLDVGANTGHFSALAARAGAGVVAIDTDAACLGALWRTARAEELDMLPLVVDLARPSPAVGWRNRECPGFLERAAGGFDAVFLLAVLHHLLVSERVPLAEVLDLAAGLTRDLAVIEFVAPEDEMFRRIARGRDHLFAGLNRARFEAACAARFQVTRAERLGEAPRWIYLLRKKPS